MNVSAALDWLFSTQFFGIKLGLDNTGKLLAAADADRTDATCLLYTSDAAANSRV